MYFSHSFNHSGRKKCRRAKTFAAILASFVLAGALLSGCSGTGTMYTPDSFEEDSEFADTAGTGMTAAAPDNAEDPHAPDNEPGRRGKRRRHIPEQTPAEAEPEEEPRTRQADLEGSGSDLYTAQAVASYYHFTLEDLSFSLPCSLTELKDAGWELLLPAAEQAGNSDTGKAQPFMIPGYSFEYFDAAPAGDSKSSKKIRLCLANFTEKDLEPASCTVCGISVSHDSDVAFKTAFGAGIGDSLDTLTAVYGTDPSVYTLTQYADGTSTVHYHFSNGLNEMETIPVLAEADDKALGELLLAETAEDGNTIRNLSLFFFRLPQE